MSAPTLAVPPGAARSDVSEGFVSPAADGAVHVFAQATSARAITAWRWGLYDIGAWSAVSLLFAAQAAARSKTPFWHIFSEQLASFVPCMLFTPLIAYVALRHRFGEGTRFRASLAHAVCLLAFLTIGSAMMGAMDWSLPWIPAGAGVWHAIRSALLGYFAIDVLIYIMIVTAVLTLAYAHDARERAVRAARLQAQLAEAQLNALGAQLHPHFLFNTLHLISALVRPEPKRAEQLIARLSELLREMLDNSDRVEVALSEELAFIEKYADIQETRFGPRLQVRFQIASDVLDVQVPRLVLQPLVENAIRHGIAPRSHPGIVEIRAQRFEDRLTIAVSDDGVGLPTERPTRDGVGLRSTRARVQQIYGADGSFTIGSRAGGGTTCTIVIPCRIDHDVSDSE